MINAGHRLSFRHEDHGARLPLWGAPSASHHAAMHQGQMSERGMAHLIDCVAAMKGGSRATRSRLRLIAVRAGSRLTPSAFARAVEKYNLMWPRGHADRRLRAVGQSAGLSRADHIHNDADPHRRADLLAPTISRS